MLEMVRTMKFGEFLTTFQTYKHERFGKWKQYTATILWYSFHTHTPLLFLLKLGWMMTKEGEGKERETKIHKYSFQVRVRAWALQIRRDETNQWREKRMCTILPINAHKMSFSVLNLLSREWFTIMCEWKQRANAMHTAQYSENTHLIMASVATAACVNTECRRNNRHMESIPCNNEKNGLEQTMGTRHFTSLHLLPHSKHINYVSTSSISSWIKSNNGPRLNAYASNKSKVHCTIDHNFCNQDAASDNY